MSNIQVLTLKNFAKSSDAEFRFGKFNIIHGKNAQGKTTILSGIKYLFNGGNEAEILSPGAENGEVVVVFDDGSRARRRISPDTKGAKFSMKDANGQTVEQPASVLREQFDSFSLDPLKFLKASNEEQTRLLLASLPITITDEQLQEATGRDFRANGEHPITQIATIRKQLFDERTDINRAVKQRTTHIDQLRKTVPETFNESASSAGKIEELEKRKEEIESKRVSRKERIAEEAGFKLDALSVEREKKLREINEWYDAEKDKIKSERDQRVEEMMQKSAASYDPVCEELRALRLNSENDTVWRSTLMTIKREAQLLEYDEAKQTELNAALDGLDRLKENLLKELPIKGLEIIDGVIHMNGTSINQISQAESLRLAVKVATLRAGDIKAVLVDNGECFDSDSFEKLVGVCEKAGVQLFVTMVTDEDEVTVDVATTAKDAVGKRKRVLSTPVPA